MRAQLLKRWVVQLNPNIIELADTALQLSYNPESDLNTAAISKLAIS